MDFDKAYWVYQEIKKGSDISDYFSVDDLLNTIKFLGDKVTAYKSILENQKVSEGEA